MQGRAGAGPKVRAGCGRGHAEGMTCLLLHSFCIYSVTPQILIKHLLCARHWGDNDSCPQGAHSLVWETDLNLITLQDVSF